MGRKEGLKTARRGGVSKRGQVLGFGIVYRMRGRMKNDVWWEGNKKPQRWQHQDWKISIGDALKTRQQKFIEGEQLQHPQYPVIQFNYLRDEF